MVHQEDQSLEKHAARTTTKPEQVRRTVVDADLALLLKGHAIQASQLADQAAKDESAMMAFIQDGARDPDTAMSLVHQLERVRRSAVEDLRQTARLLEELKYPPVALAAVLGADQRAFYASGSSRVLGRRPDGGEGE